MSYEVAKAGELIIKPEYRKDMERFFYGKYDEIEYKDLRDYTEDWKGIFLEVKYWSHKDYKNDWTGKYETSYDVQTGRFVYGVCYSDWFAMWDLEEVLEKMTMEKLYEERCNVPDWDIED